MDCGVSSSCHRIVCGSRNDCDEDNRPRLDQRSFPWDEPPADRRQHAPPAPAPAAAPTRKSIHQHTQMAPTCPAHSPHSSPRPVCNGDARSSRGVVLVVVLGCCPVLVLPIVLAPPRGVVSKYLPDVQSVSNRVGVPVAPRFLGVGAGLTWFPGSSPLHVGWRTGTGAGTGTGTGAPEGEAAKNCFPGAGSCRSSLSLKRGSDV